MRRFIEVCVVCALALAACSPVSPSSSNSNTSIPPAVSPMPVETANPPAPTATVRPSAGVAVPTSLYAGPGNSGYPAITDLNLGDRVYPSAYYGDFVLVESRVSEQSGFVWRDALDTLPADLPLLSDEQVPWQEVDMINNFIDGRITPTDDGITTHNAGQDWMDRLGPARRIDAPLRITLKLTTSDQQDGMVKFTDLPNTNSSEWWQGVHRMDLSTGNGQLGLSIRDGISQDSSTFIPLEADSNQAVTIQFMDLTGKNFVVSDESGKTIASVDTSQLDQVQLPNGLFPEKTMYIGCVTAPSSSLTLSGLKMEKLPSGAWEATSESEPGLRALAAARGITIGTELGIYSLSDARYRAIALRDFEVAILSEFSWDELWLDRNQYDFEYLDNVVDWVSRNGWQIRASHLVWGAMEENSGAIPTWLLNSQFTRDEYIQILTEHVETMVTRYQGKVTEWSVANEAPGRMQWSGADFWMDKIGPEYIEIAFRAAREADPDAILIFNENNNESIRDSVTRFTVDTMYAMVKTLKAKGVPIDVVGMQMHLLLKYSSPIAPEMQDVIETMRKFADLGVKIYITEFDVDLSQVPGTREERWAYQADLYRDMLEACLESGVCTSFATWGISDSTSWITCSHPGCVNEPDADPLMFDQEFNPKPAYFAVLETVK